MLDDSQRSKQDCAPILIVHLDTTLRGMMKEVFELEGYDTQETGRDGPRT